MKGYSLPIASYVRSGILTVIGLTLMTLVVQAADEDARALEELLGTEPTYEQKLAAYCQDKAHKGLLSFKAREQGESLEDVLKALRHYYDLPKDERLPHYIYIDHERMAQDVYRSNNKDKKEPQYWLARFYGECMDQGY